MILLTSIGFWMLAALPSSQQIEAQLHEYEGEFRKAQTLYEEILTESPGDFAARLGYARSTLELHKSSQTKESIRVLIQDLSDQIIMEEDPIPYLALRAKAFQILGKLEEAVADLRFAQGLDPDNTELARELEAAKVQLSLSRL